MVAEELIFTLDKIGIVAFAFAGVSKGVQKKLDVFGLFVVGLATAVAGGITRDLILANVPYAVSNIEYLGYAFAASIISILIYKSKFVIPNKPLQIADTLGLGAFAGAGAAVAMAADLSVFHTVLLAIVTAVGGGMLRDVLVNEIPFVLKKEVYATAAGIGGLVAYISFALGHGIVAASLIGAVVTIVVRSYALKKDFNLPVIRR